MMLDFRCGKVLVSVIAVYAMSLLSACGVDSTSSNQTNPGPAQITGSVGDGPVLAATVNFYDRTGALIETVVSDNQARYTVSLEIPDTAFPIVVEAVGGIDLVTGMAPDFTLSSVIRDRSSSTVNVNPFSTVIVESARAMPGGLSIDNINSATGTVTRQLNFGLDSALFPDPITTDVTESNVAVMVKASEALGELIRRVRDELQAGGQAVDGDGIVLALSQDLADGSLDGSGGQFADNRISALSALVSAAVLAESLTNSLTVYGVPAASAMDNAISVTHPGTPSGLYTGNVAPSSDMLAQIRAAVATVRTLSDGVELADTAATLEQLQAGVANQATNTVSTTAINAAVADAAALVVSAEASQLGTLLDTYDDRSIYYFGLAAPNDGGSAPGTDSGSGASDNPVAPAGGSVTLSWHAPTTRQDGESIGIREIAGYAIFYGTTSGRYSDSVEISDPYTTTVTVSGLAPGDYYFVMTTRDIDGLESEYSAELVRQVPSS